MMPDDVDAVVSWKPFFLNGSMGGEPQSKRAFYNQKFGEDQFKAMEPSMTRTMKKAGIDVSYDGLIAGTMDSHRLQEWATPYGKQDELVEAIFHQYFEQGKSPADKVMLVEAAGKVGLDEEAAAAFLASDAGKIEVQQQAAAVRNAYGVTGVPFFVVRNEEDIGNPFGCSGAQEPDTLLGMMEKALANAAAAAAATAPAAAVSAAAVPAGDGCNEDGVCPMPSKQ